MKISAIRTLAYAVAALAAVTLGSCDDKKFRVDGSITDAKDSVLYFENMSLDGPVVIDSVKLGGDGEFSFSEKSPEAPEFYRLRIAGQIINLSVDSTENITVKAAYPTMATAYEVDGSAECARIKELALMQNDLQRRVTALGRDAALTPAEARDSLLRAIVLGNRSALALTLLDMGLQEKSGEEVSALLDSFPEAMQRHPGLCELRSRIARMRTDIGRPCVDISGQTPRGDTLSLGEVIRRPGCRYVLLDFGALWCGPCREEFPNLAALREKYGPQGFEIFGVSFDVSPERWRECIETYGMEWPQIHQGFGRAPRETEAWNDYALDGIPACFLIDARDGRIVAKNLRGEALAGKVAQLLME